MMKNEEWEKLKQSIKKEIENAYEAGHKAGLQEAVKIVEKMEKWGEPIAGAGKHIGALYGAGMYAQYDFDKKKHEEQIKQTIKNIIDKIK